MPMKQHRNISQTQTFTGNISQISKMCMQTACLTSGVVAPGVGKPASHPNCPQHCCGQLKSLIKKDSEEHKGW